MMAPDPLRSATTVEGAEDTSLALPSDRSLSSGRQRVLDQVHSIKRTKSRQGRSVSSPTSPSPKLSTYSEFGTFKFMPSKGNDLLSRTNSTMSTSYTKVANFQKTHSQSARVPKGRHISSSTIWDQQTIKKPNGLKTSRSDPTLVPPLSPAQSRTLSTRRQNTIRSHQQSTSSMVNGINLTNSQTGIVQSPSIQPQFDGRLGTMKMLKMEQTCETMLNSMSIMDITLKEAVVFLDQPEEDKQHFGASAIQHYTFINDDAKIEVQALEGIPPLVNLLDSPNPQVSQTAAGALRNLVFKNKVNKVQVYDCGGIAKALNLLKKTDSTETKKQITGLLWNLSSEDKLKQDLMNTALPALTERVVVPFVSNDDKQYVDSSVFYNATGCLRNLSSGGVNERNIMRNCTNLISSLTTFVESCISKETTDDKSLENCVCILHNLTYQLGKERPEAFSEYSQSRASVSQEKKNATVGCFSPRSSKVPNECSLDRHPEKSNDSSQSGVKSGVTSGVKLLCQPSVIDNYLWLLEYAKEEPIQEASCGALQNLSASSEESGTVCKVLLEKFKDLPILESLIASENPTIRKTALSLLDNMSRSRVQVDMAKQMLPELVCQLGSSTDENRFNDEDAVALGNTILRLTLTDSEVTKKLVDKNMVSQLIKLSGKEASYPNGSKVVSALLYNMWNDKNLYTIVKKMGFEKINFVNKRSSEAFQSTFQLKND
ncbi:plakophilin-1 [Austrofundulus limnaeus]|uniref:Plakophilin-1 n=1 Tax=Austrofundulus limnaeus TaxID=52670 RepID=A0A2I4C075_AUSLI|nr:PREDICTED: plakophilin-1 [Austrofundulus limnaeus]